MVRFCFGVFFFFALASTRRQRVVLSVKDVTGKNHVCAVRFNLHKVCFNGIEVNTMQHISYGKWGTICVFFTNLLIAIWNIILSWSDFFWGRIFMAHLIKTIFNANTLTQNIKLIACMWIAVTNDSLVWIWNSFEVYQISKTMRNWTQ